MSLRDRQERMRQAAIAERETGPEMIQTTTPVRFLRRGTLTARTQQAAPAAASILVKLLDKAGNPTGSSKAAYGFFVDEAETFDEVTPIIAEGVDVPVFYDQTGKLCLKLTLTWVGEECPE